MLAVQRSPPAPTRLLPWSLPREPTWASPPSGIDFVPVESPPRTVQEYVMQAARPSAPEQPVCGEEVDAAGRREWSAGSDHLGCALAVITCGGAHEG